MCLFLNNKKKKRREKSIHKIEQTANNPLHKKIIFTIKFIFNNPTQYKISKYPIAISQVTPTYYSS